MTGRRRATGLLLGAIVAAGCHRSDEVPSVRVDAAPPPTPATASAATVTPDAAPGVFEGVIDLSVVARGDADEDSVQESYQLTVRGARVRWPIDAGYAYRVYDGDERAIFTVYPQEKVVQVVKEDALAADAGADAGAAGGWTFVSFDPAGAVAGQPCDRVHATLAGTVVSDACIVHGFPALPLDLLSSAAAKVVPFAGALREQGLFPIAVTSVEGAKPKGKAGVRRVTPGNGYARSRLVALRIERRSVADVEVAIPPFPRTETRSFQAGKPAKR